MGYRYISYPQVTIQDANIVFSKTSGYSSEYQCIEAQKLTIEDSTIQGLSLIHIFTGEQIDTALAILTAIPADAEDIGEINVADTQYIKIYTVAGTEVRIGDSQNFDEKYLLYSTILLENERKAEKAIKYIDVSIVSKPAFAYE